MPDAHGEIFKDDIMAAIKFALMHIPKLVEPQVEPTIT